MNSKMIVLIGVVSIALAGCSLLPGSNEAVEDSSMESEAVMEAETSMNEAVEPEMMETTYTMSEVGEHATEDDCWIVINDTVYDVTEFIAAGKHPGGDVIRQRCGTDVTEVFFDRPNGSGSHSKEAQGFAETMAIGSVQTEQ